MTYSHMVSKVPADVGPASVPADALARTRHLAQRAMDLARMGFWVAELDQPGIFWVSEELAALLGVPAGPVQVDTVRLRYEDDTTARLVAAFDLCAETGEPYVEDAVYRHPDGRRMNVRVHAEAERDAEGRVVRIVGIMVDRTEETHVLRRMAASEQMLSDFLAVATDWCWQTDAEHRFVPLPFEREQPEAIDPDHLHGRLRWDMDVPDESRLEIARLRAAMEAREPFHNLVYTVNTDVGPLRIRTSGNPFFDADGQFLGYRGTSSDVTELQQTESLLRKRSEALAEAQRIGRIGSWSMQVPDGVVTWSEELFATTGYDPATFDRSITGVMNLCRPEDVEKLNRIQHEAKHSGGTATTDVRLLCGDGHMRDFAVSLRAEYADGEVVRYVGMAQDISERKDAQRKLEELAYSDPLTGLANRARFKEALTTAIGQALLESRYATLYMVDLDRFKEVNDAFGHAAGDELLCRVAAMLRREFGEGAFIARLGGDEFAVLLERNDPHEDVTLVADDLIAILSGPVELSSGEAFVGATVGIALLPEHATSADQAMRHADLALYTGKEAGRGRCAVFDEALGYAVEQRLLLARELRHAIDQNELHAHYQPQVCIRSGKVVGFEALLRWTHRERGPISPGEFIPVAESSGIIVDLGLWILYEACRQARSWLDQGLPPRTMSVNVSPAQFWTADFETAVAAVLTETGLPPELLCLELTESLFVHKSEQRVSRTLQSLSALGVKLALDDFGSGYSSLGYLTRLPFDRLKVDRSFIDGVAAQPQKRKLLAGIIALGQGLGLSTVAEGAERSAEVDVLRELGCDTVQGYVHSRPVAPDRAPLVAAEIEAKLPAVVNEARLVPDAEVVAMIAAAL